MNINRITYPKFRRTVKENFKQGLIIKAGGNRYTTPKITDPIKCILEEFKISQTFPKPVIEECEKIDPFISKEEIRKRRNLTELTCFTIDPEDAKDFDDAVSIEKTENGSFLLGVHIADVDHYVNKNKHIDSQALSRGTSIYLPDRVIPMLPSKLSENLCSLKPDENRLTLTIMIKIDTQGNIREYEIFESLIKSKARLSYESAEELIHSNPVRSKKNSNWAEISSALKTMYKLSKILDKKRLERGYIDFDVPEVKISLDGNGKVLDIQKKKRLSSHILIEEFMLLANQCVAEYITKNKTPMIYRVHETPDDLKIEDFALLAKTLNYKFDRNKSKNPKYIQRFLHKTNGQKDHVLISQILLTCMQKAIYSTQNVGHFGLALNCYTHFTSPIRRYPDLIVHRILKNKFKNRIDNLSEIAGIASEREQIAVKIERESIKLKQVEFIKNKVGDIFEGVISGVQPYGLFVELNDTLAEGLVHVSALKNDYYTFSEKQFALVGRRTKRRFQLGDSVNVQVVKVDSNKRLIDFILVDDKERN
ncbi:MAG: ribonuclease R [bacterium]